jgi:hypothetical protein
MPLAPRFHGDDKKEDGDDKKREPSSHSRASLFSFPRRREPRGVRVAGSPCLRYWLPVFTGMTKKDRCDKKGCCQACKNNKKTGRSIHMKQGILMVWEKNPSNGINVLEQPNTRASNTRTVADRISDHSIRG